MYGPRMYESPPGPTFVVPSATPGCVVVMPPVPVPVNPEITLNLRAPPCPLTRGMLLRKGVGRGVRSLAGASRSKGTRPVLTGLVRVHSFDMRSQAWAAPSVDFAISKSSIALRTLADLDGSCLIGATCAVPM